jgi:elongin-A
VWDVGDLEYPVIREFLLGLPREQLEEVENNSNVRANILMSWHGSWRRLRRGVSSCMPRALLPHPCKADLQHLKEDTDWLWEIFLLEDHPTQYERCNTKDGEPRTRGWRRMYRVRHLGLTCRQLG